MCDITRPQPRALQLAVLAEVMDGVVRDEDVVVLIATGTHRASTEDERLEMLGPEVLARWRVVDHDARDDASLVDLGMVGDVPVSLNREWVAADLRITTGFVEPHFFAGFSGGPKMVAPGLAGLETVLALHNAARIGDPRATWGVTVGNPVHDAIRAIAAATRVDFALDVLIDDQHRITRAFAGEVLAMHATAIAAARDEAMQPVERPFDIVVTTNSGYPLDQNLYQAVKGMSAAATVVAEGGTILCAAECRDGLPDHGRYAALLASADSPAALMTTDPREPGDPARPVAGPGAGTGPGQGPRAPSRRRPVRRTGPRGTSRARRGGDAGCRSPRGRQPARDRVRAPAGSPDDPVPGLAASPHGRSAVPAQGSCAASGR